MGNAYFYNMTDEPVVAILNDDLSNAITITALAKDSSADSFDFSFVKFERDSDEQPHGKFGTNNKVTFSVGKEAYITISNVTGKYDHSYDIIVFIFYESIVVRVEDQAYIYKPNLTAEVV